MTGDASAELVPMVDTRIAIVDDHALLADALAVAFRSSGLADVHVIDASVPDETIIASVVRLEPDAVLLDIHLGGDRLAVPLVGPLSSTGAKVVIITSSRDPMLLGACVEEGAAALLDKAQPFEDLVQLVSAAANGASVLSPSAREVLLSEMRAMQRDRTAQLAPFDALTRSEARVLRDLIDGRTAEAVATDHAVAIATVRTHIRSILTKLEVRTQLAAVAAARRAGWEWEPEPTEPALPPTPSPGEG